MTFVDQIKKIGKAVGVDVAGSNIADCLNSLERGVASKTAVPEVPKQTHQPEPTAELTPRRSRRERIKAE